MPTGIIINSLSIVIGGILGTVVGDKLSEDFKEKLNMILDGKKDFLTDPLKNKILNNNIKQDSKADRRKKYLNDSLW